MTTLMDDPNPLQGPVSRKEAQRILRPVTIGVGALLLAHQAAELSGAVGPVLPWACGLALAAAVLLVAVRTCPELGAVAALTLTVVVADLSASA